MKTRNDYQDTYKDKLLVRPQTAAAIGLVRALIVEQMIYWLGINEQNHKFQTHFAGERWWMYCSYQDWRDKNFPFLSVSTIRRALDDCVEIGIVLKAPRFDQYGNQTGNWYTVDYDVLNETIQLWLSEPSIHAGVHSDHRTQVSNVNITNVYSEHAMVANLSNHTEISPENNEEILRKVSGETVALVEIDSNAPMKDSDEPVKDAYVPHPDDPEGLEAFVNYIYQKVFTATERSKNWKLSRSMVNRLTRPQRISVYVGADYRSVNKLIDETGNMIVEMSVLDIFNEEISELRERLLNKTTHVVRQGGARTSIVNHIAASTNDASVKNGIAQFIRLGKIL